VRYLQELGRDVVMPKDGYQGEYIREIARAMRKEQGDHLADGEDREIFRAAAVKAIFAEILATCKTLDIRFDTFKNELDLVRDGRVDKVVHGLEDRGLVVENEGALWLRAEPLGLPKDRVLVRSGDAADPIYRTPDIAYHIEKLERGFDLIVDVFGADHIAEHEDVIAAVKALGHETSRIKAIIYQFVTLTRGGEKVKMSTRKATYVTLDELIEEVSPTSPEIRASDVVRFFFLFRKHNSHLDFDLDLAKKQAPENPVFYVQYAHARLASVFREAEKANLTLPEDTSTIDLDLLSAEELDLAKRVLDFPEVATAAAQALESHRIPFYLLELAGEFHRYYNQSHNRIIGDERGLSLARLYLASLVKMGIAQGLELLGVSAPERM
jgi:arginyl-tRNA synthetase